MYEVGETDLVLYISMEFAVSGTLGDWLPELQRNPRETARLVAETAQAVDTLAQFLKASRMTVLLVEHDMEVVFRLAHRITVLHRGAVIADGAPDQVKADPAVQDAYLGGFE